MLLGENERLDDLQVGGLKSFKTKKNILLQATLPCSQILLTQKKQTIALKWAAVAVLFQFYFLTSVIPIRLLLLKFNRRLHRWLKEMLC